MTAHFTRPVRAALSACCIASSFLESLAFVLGSGVYRPAGKRLKAHTPHSQPAMTFYYDEDEDELTGNNMFYEGDDGPIATRDGDSLHIDVTEIMERGRGLRKLREMEGAVEDAIQAHEDE